MISRGYSSNQRNFYVSATAYVSFCDTGCIGRTKVGINVSSSIYHQDMRIIAVDPSIIKLHSIVRVDTKDESFIAYAGDTGEAIQGYEIDILVATRNTNKAIAFGRQNVKMSVIREGLGGN